MEPVENITPRCNVSLTSFYIDTFPVTQMDYNTIMGLNPSFYRSDLECPVEQVTWFDAVLYCNARSKLEGKDTVYYYTAILGKVGDSCWGLVNLSCNFTRNGYRLPTQAEYGYAMQGNMQTRYFWSNTWDTLISNQYCWSSNNSDDQTHPVGGKLPNGFGLYDMAGNVWEWCNDWLGRVSNKTTLINPIGSSSSAYRSMRGGSYYSKDTFELLTSTVLSDAPYERYQNVGFRVVCSDLASGSIYFPPTITSQPPYFTSIAEGQKFRLSLSSFGNPEPKYQWYKNGIKINNAVDSILVFDSALRDDAGSYTVSVYNTQGDILSNTATLKVYFPIVNGMRALPGGTFQMGDYYENASPIHSVTLSAFRIDTVPVTQGEYMRVLATNPSTFHGDDNRPVENISWFDAVLYCNKRSLLEGKDSSYSYTEITRTPGYGCSNLKGIRCDSSKNGYRLPTEAEYEYALRGGTITPAFWSPLYVQDSINKYCWCGWAYLVTTYPVAQKYPNEYGLYDMVGNVFEWCNDLYGPYKADMQLNPMGSDTGSTRVLRGAAYNTQSPYDLKSSFRTSRLPIYYSPTWGFRTVCRP